MSYQDFKEFLSSVWETVSANLNLTDDVLVALHSQGILTDHEYSDLRAQLSISQRAISFHDVMYNNPDRMEANVEPMIKVFKKYKRSGIVLALQQWTLSSCPQGSSSTAIDDEEPSFRNNPAPPKQATKQTIEPIGYYNFDLRSIPAVLAERHVELTLMEAVLQKPVTTNARIVILVGMAGAGKTTLAKLYTKTENFRQRQFQNFIWIDAEYENAISKTFKDLHNLTSKVRIDQGKQLSDGTIQTVYKLLWQFPTLLIFDNVEEVPIVEKYLPAAVLVESAPTIIITTRLRKGWNELEGCQVPVGKLSMDVSEKYIRECLAKPPKPIPDLDTHWHLLAERFGGLVIALRSALSSIVEQNKLNNDAGLGLYTIQQLLDDVSKVDILEPSEDPEDPAEMTYKPLRQLWTKILTQLPTMQHGRTAELILYVLAFFRSEGVPTEWFYKMFHEVPERQVAYAINVLTSWSLAQNEGNRLVMHRVLQEIVVSRVKSDEGHLKQFLEWLLEAILLLKYHFLDHMPVLPQSDFLESLISVVKHLRINGVISDCEIYFSVKMSDYNYPAFIDYLDELNQQVRTGKAKLLPNGLTLLAEAFPSEIYLIPLWIQQCSSKTWLEKLQFVSKMVSRAHSLSKSTEQLETVVTISKFLIDAASQGPQVYNTQLPDLQTIIKFLCVQYHRHFELFVKPVGNLPDKNVLREMLLNLWNNATNAILKLVRDSSVINCQTLSAFLSSVKIAMLWQKFFHKERVFLFDSAKCSRTKSQQFHSAIVAQNPPSEDDQQCKQLLQCFYNILPKDQFEVEKTILQMFSNFLDPTKQHAQNVYNLLQEVTRFVIEASEMAIKPSALPVSMLILCLDTNMRSVEKFVEKYSSPTNSNSQNTLGEQFMLFKLQTLKQLMYVSLPTLTKGSINAVSLAALVDSVEPSFPYIKNIIESIHKISGGCSEMPNEIVKLVYELESRAIKLGYKSSKVFSLYNQLVSDAIKHRILNSVLPLIEQITRAAEAESEREIGDAKHKCTCFHIKYQTLLAKCYFNVHEVHSATARALKVCEHSLRCCTLLRLDGVDEFEILRDILTTTDSEHASLLQDLAKRQVVRRLDSLQGNPSSSENLSHYQMVLSNYTLIRNSFPKNTFQLADLIARFR